MTGPDFLSSFLSLFPSDFFMFFFVCLFFPFEIPKRLPYQVFTNVLYLVCLPVIRNRNAGPGSISYFRKGVFHTNCSLLTAPKILGSPQKSEAEFLVGLPTPFFVVFRYVDGRC